MTLRQALSEGFGLLSRAGVDTPVLDATVLLAEAMGVSKERLLADLPEEMADSPYAEFRRYLSMRLQGLPVSYIRRKKEFYGLELYVDERVLVPRPETETLVEIALELARASGGEPRLHDACTGSGCIAVACSRSLAAIEASVSDISGAALEVCALNCRRHLGRELPSAVSDLLSGVTGPFDLLTANPPYLTDAELEAMRSARWPEPELALAGGPDGTDLARRLIREAPGLLSAGGSLVMEIAPAQAAALSADMERARYRDINVHPDLSGRDRVISGRRAA